LTEPALCNKFSPIGYPTTGEIDMKQDYEKPELVIYEDLSDVTAGVEPVSGVTG
jgi:hypothetical protein